MTRRGRVAVGTGLTVVVVVVVVVGFVVVVRGRSGSGDAEGTRAPIATTGRVSSTTTDATPPVTGVSIAAVGDMVCPPGAATTANECRQQQVASQLAADASVAQVLALGDLQYENGALSGFRSAYDASYGQVKAKTRPVPGNHEYATAGATGYYTYFGTAAGDPTKGYYSFDVGTKWHVVALNSNCSVVGCAVGGRQEQWLRADLAASGRPCTIAFWHHPRFSSGTHGDDSDVAPLWSALDDGGAELVLTGHDHQYERFDPQTATGTASAHGIREFVVGTGGRSLYTFRKPRPNSVQRISTFGYLKLVLGDSAYSWQFVAEGGAVLDSGTGACH